MPPRQDGSWERLGQMLVQRRIELDPRYRNRRLFADERGLNWRLLHDLERAKRANFEPETIAAVEVAYGLEPGSIGRALAGGNLEVRAITPAPPAVTPDPPLPAADPALDLYIASVRRDLAKAMAEHGPSFTPEQAFTAPHEAAAWADPDNRMPDDDERVRLIAQMRLFTRQYAERDPECRVVLAAAGFPLPG